MKHYSEYRRADGTFTSQTVTTCQQRPKATESTDWIEGHHDHRSKRVDLESGAVVAHEVPADEIGRQAAAVRRRSAQAQIDVLEHHKMPRAIREHALGYDGARKRLQDLDNQIAALRADLK